MRTLQYIAFAIVPSAIVIAAAMAWSFSVVSTFETNCTDAGGHVYSDDGDSNTGLCLTADGRVIEIPR